ncbi:OmpA family protein [Deltaproteobacteria bacterium OttesenSCG-928-M10]|nr:OmpA family protein [Deltaproteobacteria bacterium OttesenSCG-928-M10]
MHKTIIILTGLLLSLLTAVPVFSAGAEVVVQVMSVQDEAAAAAEAARLFDSGVPAFSRAEDVPEKGVWNRVYVGPFETETDAKAAAEALKSQGVIKDFLLKKQASAADVQAAAQAAAAAAAAPVGQAGPDGRTALPPVAGGEAGPGAVAVPNDQPGGPVHLPVAQTPTYGEPVSPEQAREMGLDQEGGASRIPTYGEAGLATYEQAGSGGGLTAYGQPGSSSQAAAPAPGRPGLPEGFKAGDDMPGLVMPAQAGGAAVPAPVAVAPADAPAADTSAAPAKPEETAAAPAADDRDELVYAPLPDDATQSFTDDPYAGGDEAPDGEQVASPSPGAGRATSLAPSAGDGDYYAPVLVAQADIYNDAPMSQIYGGGSKISGFTMLVDLSSSMRRLVPCQQRVKEEAVASLLRKMNHRIPSQPYSATLRVFGYKQAWTKRDFTTTYYGPSTYNRDEFEDAIAKLVAADSISPFAEAISAADSELQVMGSPKAVLMFSDFEPAPGSGNPVQKASNARRRYGSDLKVYTFYVSRQSDSARLAKNIAQAGGGSAFDICRMLDDDEAFENMMMEIFGPSDAVPCADADGDGVCDEDDLCPDTPRGAPVDERGCWVAAYSQFFDFDKAEVKSAFLPRLKHAAELINKNPDIPRVTIAGHTDNIGNPNYNMELGRRRAQAVYDLMVKYGVSPGRLKIVSFGEQHPIAPNDTEEGRAKNRRVEFHIGDAPNRGRMSD